MKIDENKSYRRISDNKINALKELGISKGSLPKEGELVKGEIVDLSQNSVKIKISDGQIIEAKLTDAFEFNIGQKLSFLVKESNLEQLLLKPLMEGGETATNKLIQALELAGLSTSPENVEVVKKLVEHQMPIDTETLKKVIPFAKQYADTDIDEMLLLVKNNIPVSKGNLEQLHLMIKDENRILQSLASLSDELSNNIIDASGKVMTEQMIERGSSSEKILNKVLAAIPNEGEIGVKTPTLAEAEVTAETINIKTLVTPKNDLSARLNQDEKTTVFLLNNIMSDKEIKVLTTELNKLIKNDESFSALNLDKLTIDDLLKDINELEVSAETKSNLIHTFSKRIAYNLLNREIFMNEKHLEDPENISDFYDKLNEKVKNLLLVAGEAGTKDHEGIVKEADQIKNTTQFMSDLNQKFNYIQLPIMLNDKLTHSEIYVFNNKNQLKNQKGTVTALIRLDLVNLGHLDIHVTKAEQNLTLQFFTDDAERNKKIEGKVFGLHNQLQKLGFKVLGITVNQKTKDFNVVDDFLDTHKEAREVKRYTFDMRV